MDEALPLAADARASLALAGTKARPDVQEAALEFEAYLLRMVLSEMRKTVASGGLFEGSGTQGYRALMDDALAREAAARGGFGLGDQLLSHWESRR